MDCFASGEQFSDFEFLLQQMFHIQDSHCQRVYPVDFIFSKVTSLQCIDCNFTTCRLYHIYFLENFPEIFFCKAAGLDSISAILLKTLQHISNI